MTTNMVRTNIYIELFFEEKLLIKMFITVYTKETHKHEYNNVK